MTRKLFCHYISHAEYTKIISGDRSIFSRLGRKHIFIEPTESLNGLRLKGLIGCWRPISGWGYHTENGIKDFSYYTDLQSGTPGLFTFDKAIFFHIIGYFPTSDGRVIVEIERASVASTNQNIIYPCPCGSGREYEDCCYKIVMP